MAQQLFLTLALQRPPGVPATADGAREAMRRWASERLGDAPAELVLDNGSGLSRQTRVTAQWLARLLQQAYASAVMPELMSSLPVNGLDGTLFTCLCRPGAPEDGLAARRGGRRRLRLVRQRPPLCTGRDHQPRECQPGPAGARRPGAVDDSRCPCPLNRRPLPMLQDLPLTDWIGYAAASLTTASFVPQALLTLRTRDVSGISLGMYSAFTLGTAFWLLYGLRLGQWPIVVANALTLGLAAVILFTKIRAGWGTPRR